jgi:hypothetical protein
VNELTGEFVTRAYGLVGESPKREAAKAAPSSLTPEASVCATAYGAAIGVATGAYYAANCSGLI